MPEKRAQRVRKVLGYRHPPLVGTPVFMGPCGEGDFVDDRAAAPNIANLQGKYFLQAQAASPYHNDQSPVSRRALPNASGEPAFLERSEGAVDGHGRKGLGDAPAKAPRD